MRQCGSNNYTLITHWTGSCIVQWLARQLLVPQLLWFLTPLHTASCHHFLQSMFISLHATASHIANMMVDICDCIITHLEYLSACTSPRKHSTTFVNWLRHTIIELVYWDIVLNSTVSVTVCSLGFRGKCNTATCHHDCTLTTMALLVRLTAVEMMTLSQMAATIPRKPTIVIPNPIAIRNTLP